MGLHIEEVQTTTLIDKKDMLRVWNQTGPLHCSGTPKAQTGSESTASPRLRAEEDETTSELMWNPLDLHPDDLSTQGDEEGECLVWDPIGLAVADKFQMRDSMAHEGSDGIMFISKPPGLEDLSEGHDHFWSRSTTAGTADHEHSSSDPLATEMAAILELIQTGQCVAPWLDLAENGSVPGAPGLAGVGASKMPEVRGSPYWPCPGTPFSNGFPQPHNFCPWCGSTRVCFHRFCPQCGVLYPDLATATVGY